MLFVFLTYFTLYNRHCCRAETRTLLSNYPPIKKWTSKLKKKSKKKKMLGGSCCTCVYLVDRIWSYFFWSTLDFSWDTHRTPLIVLAACLSEAEAIRVLQVSQLNMHIYIWFPCFQLSTQLYFLLCLVSLIPINPQQHLFLAKTGEIVGTYFYIL